MALNKSAVHQADDDFYRNHPEMVNSDGSRVPIDPNDPSQRGAVKEWNASYKQHEQTQKAPPPSAAKKPADTVTTCPYANKKPCCFKSITISCGHTHASSKIGSSPRSYKLIMPQAPDSKKPAEYHVLAGQTKEDKVTITLQGGPCLRGHTGWPQIVAAGGPEEEVKQTELDLKAVCNSESVVENWQDYIWPLSASPKTYTVHADACEGATNTAATIMAFPDIQWNVGWSLDFGGTTDTFASKAKSGTSSPNASAASDTVKLTYDEKTTDLTPQFEEFAKTSLKLIDTIRTIQDKLGPTLSQWGDTQLSISYPNLHLTYTNNAIEKPNDYDLDYAFTVTFDAKPFFRLTGKTDILDWIISVATGPFGTALVKIKERAKKGAGEKGKLYANADISITVSASTGIDFSLAWTKSHGQAFKDSTVSGNIDASIPFIIEGNVSANMDILKVSIGAGARVGAKTAIGATLQAAADQDGGHGIYGQGQFRWEGITVYYVLYIKGSVTTAEDPDDDSDKKPDADTEGKGEKERSCVLSPPQYWPDQPTKHYLFGG